MCGSITYISWSIDFALYLVIDLNYFYILRNGTGRGYSCPEFVPLRAPVLVVHDVGYMPFSFMLFDELYSVKSKPIISLFQTMKI